jgi:hypothetical protein
MDADYRALCAFVQAFGARPEQSRVMRTLKRLTLAMMAACVTGAGGAEPPAVPDFGWLSGHWCGGSADELIEEHWLASGGDLMLGLGRTLKAGKTVSFEFLRISHAGGITNYLAQPQGAAPTAFRLTDAGADWARFENPRHDFPRRVEYRRTTDGLHAEVAGPGQGGEELVIRFDYRPCESHLGRGRD